MLNSESDAFHERWCRIVQDYSRLNLTNTKDKLPALSGIAKQIGAAHDDTYLAGLWLGQLAQGLSWYRRGPHSEPLKEERRAPSWSWVGFDGSIFFHSRTWLGNPIRPLRVLEAMCEPLGVDPHGEVRSGHIKLRGLLCEGVLKSWDRNPTNAKLVVKNEEHGNIHLDRGADDAGRGRRSVTCLLLCQDNFLL